MADQESDLELARRHEDHARHWREMAAKAARRYAALVAEGTELLRKAVEYERIADSEAEKARHLRGGT